MQIVSFAAGKNRDMGRDLIFIEVFSKGCLSCGIHQSMTYRCNSRHPLFAAMADAVKHTRTHVRNQKSSRWNKSRSLMSDAPLSSGEAYVSTRLLLPLWQINKRGLKLKGILAPSPPPHAPTPSPPPDEFKATASIIYFLSFSSLYMVESTRINAAYEVRRGSRRGGENPQSLQILYLWSFILEQWMQFFSN